MVSNGDRYKSMQVLPADHEKFTEKCKDLGICHTDGFKLCVEVWINNV